MLIISHNPSLQKPWTLRRVLAASASVRVETRPHLRDFGFLEAKMEAVQAVSSEPWMFWAL